MQELSRELFISAARIDKKEKEGGREEEGRKERRKAEK